MKHLNNFSYEDAMNFIHGAQKLGSKLGLANIRELVRRIGDPQKRLRFIHVAGTNGKGTVTVSVARILQAQGYRVGAYTSPYVYRFNERIMVDGVPVSDAEIAVHTKTVRMACEEMVRDGYCHPTEFEIVTAVGFLCFAAAACEYVVLEVGLGGRLDATNVIDTPICSVITRIGYDHMQYLGDTLSDIASEKCGIIREGVPVISYRGQPPEAMDVIRRVCAEKKAPLYLAEKTTVETCTYAGSTFSVGMRGSMFLPLGGMHMVQNAATALRVMDVLRKIGIAVSEDAVREGLSNVVHRGRFEVIGENPLFILDGAHNMDGIEALADTVKRTLAGKKIVSVFGMLADKEYVEASRIAAELSNKVYMVTVPSPRAVGAAELADAVHPYTQNVQAMADIPAAVCAAYADKPDVILAFGSLYMLGDVYRAAEEAGRETQTRPK